MNRLLTILLLLGATAHGQIDNPPTSVNIVDSTATGRAVFTATNAAAAATAVGLGAANQVTFAAALIGTATDQLEIISEEPNLLSLEYRTNGTIASAIYFQPSQITFGGPINFNTTNEVATTRTNLSLGATWLTNTDATNFRTAIGLGATNNVTFSNITASGTLAVTGNVTMSGVNNTATAQTADSASSLMTRGLSDVRYLGEMWHAWRMSSYNTATIPVGVFKSAPCVLFTNGQSAFYVEAFLDPSKYAGKTVRVLAYCRVDTTNGGNVQGVGRIVYLTNNAGGPESNFPITVGGQSHGLIGIFTNSNTDVFPVTTSTNQYLIFTSNVGTISNNATMIIAAFGFNRATNLTTFTNGNLYMQAVEVVVENP